MKSTKIPRWENATLGIGFQFFNFFNHPTSDFRHRAGALRRDYHLPGTATYQHFGDWASMGADRVAPRMIQLKAELKF